jgi:hypothetical protein
MQSIKQMIDSIILATYDAPRPTHIIVSPHWVQALRLEFLRRDDRLWRKRDWGKPKA